MSESMNINIDDMDSKQLADLKSRIESKEVSQKKKDLKQLRLTIKAMVVDSVFTMDEVFPSTKKAPTRTVEPKYVNPKDSSSTWTGRGRKPTWVVKCLAAGKTMEELKI